MIAVRVMTGALAVVLAALILAAPAGAAADRVLVDAGWQSTCATTKDRQVKCWGPWFAGTAGWDKPVVQGIDPAAGPITDLEVTSHRGCVVQAGRVWCWAVEPTFTAKPLIAEQVPGLTTVTDLTIHEDDRCALLADGTVSCWGPNRSGQVSGDGTTTPQPTPRPVDGISDAVSISIGGGHTCAARSTGTVLCWGQDWWGAMGVSPRSGTTHTPTPIPNITDATQVSTNGTNTCVIRRNKTVMCLGKNDEGFLGTDPTDRFIGATQVPGISDVVQITAGVSSQCALDARHNTYCWGWNDMGQSGSGTTSRAITTPTRVTGLPYATSVRGNYSTYCATTHDGIWCWGAGGPNFGNPDFPTGNSNNPVKVTDSEAWLPQVDGIIDTPGPVTRMATSTGLACERRVDYQALPVFSGCGTWVRVGDRLYGPDLQALDAAWPSGVTPYEPLGQHERGTGTADDPYEIETRVAAGTVQITQRDRYVVGAARSSTTITFQNIGDQPETVAVFTAGDCVHADGREDPAWSYGYGHRTAAQLLTGGVSCWQARSGGRSVSWAPSGLEAHGFVGSLGDVARTMLQGDGTAAPCLCNRLLQHAAGLAWTTALAPNESAGAAFALQFSENDGTGAGPLAGNEPWSNISTDDELVCERRSTRQLQPVFDGCGTWVAIGDRLFGPSSARLGAGWPAATSNYEFESQTRLGTGTTSDPFRIRTVVMAGTLRVTQTDSYQGPNVQTSVSVENTGSQPVDATVFHAADCVHGGRPGERYWSYGYPRRTADGRRFSQVACTETNLGGRTTDLRSTTGPVMAGPLRTLVTKLAARSAFTNTCTRCGAFDQDAIGTSRAMRLAAGENQTLVAEVFTTGIADPPARPPSGDMTDADNDGIPDDWERPGVHVDNNGDGVAELDLSALGAQPGQRDLFLQLNSTQWDCVLFVECSGSWKLIAPRASAVAKVQQAFGARGIVLHVDAGPEFVMNPYTKERWGARSAIGPPTRITGSPAWSFETRFDALSDRMFRPTSFPNADRHGVFRKGVYSALVFNGAKRLGGIAALGGDRLVVGNYWDCGDPCGAAHRALVPRSELSEAAILMHELGHTLGLDHGGDSPTNHKPNYPSIMNYLYADGVPISNRTEWISDESLTFSDGNLAPMDERGLDERGGIGPIWVTVGVGWSCAGPLVFVALDTAHDWNCDGATSETAVRTDVNEDGQIGVLTDHDDWSNLEFEMRATDELGEAPLAP